MKPGYRPEIDGLRAIAVLAVLVFHAGLSNEGKQLLSGGYLGVDVFFVISGYLIARLIFSELEQGDFSLAKFYERRARRILPALYVVLLACLIPAWLWLDQVQLEEFGWGLGAVSLFVANILFWTRTGYFSGGAELNPLLHTWSLAVEEQFYMVFPLLVIVLWRVAKAWIPWLLAGLLLASLAAAVWLSETDPSAAFYLAHTRAWEILAGVMIALWLAADSRPRWWWMQAFLPAVGLMLIATSMVVMDKQSRVPGVAALLPVSGTVLVLVFGGGGDFASRMLASRLLVGVGLVSYSLYLWHQPVFVFARQVMQEKPGWAEYCFLAAVSLALAVGSYFLVERPLRRPGFLKPSTVATLALLVGLSLLLLGATAVKWDGFPVRISPQAAELAGFKRYKFKPLYRDRTCLLHPDQGYDELAAECISEREGAILLWGDSHAAALYPGIRELYGAANITQITTASCPPVIGMRMRWVTHCEETNRQAMAHIARASYSKIIIMAHWPVYKSLGGMGLAHNSADYLALFDSTLEQLAAAGHSVTVLGGFPIWYPSLPRRLMKYLQVQGTIPDRLPLSMALDTPALDKQMQQIATRHGHNFVSIIDKLCPTRECPVRIDTAAGDKTLLQWDASHPTREGAILIARKVLGYRPAVENN